MAAEDGTPLGELSESFLDPVTWNQVPRENRILLLHYVLSSVARVTLNGCAEGERTNEYRIQLGIDGSTSANVCVGSDSASPFAEMTPEMWRSYIGILYGRFRNDILRTRYLLVRYWQFHFYDEYKAVPDPDRPFWPFLPLAKSLHRLYISCPRYEPLRIAPFRLQVATLKMSLSGTNPARDVTSMDFLRQIDGCNELDVDYVRGIRHAPESIADVLMQLDNLKATVTDLRFPHWSVRALLRVLPQFPRVKAALCHGFFPMGVRNHFPGLLVDPFGDATTAVTEETFTEPARKSCSRLHRLDGGYRGNSHWILNEESHRMIYFHCPNLLRLFFQLVVCPGGLRLLREAFGRFQRLLNLTMVLALGDETSQFSEVGDFMVDEELDPCETVVRVVIRPAAGLGSSVVGQVLRFGFPVCPSVCSAELGSISPEIVQAKFPQLAVRMLECQ